MIKLRIATKDDGASLANIYKHYVINTTVTFEFEAPSAEEFSARIARTLEKYPYVVAEEDGCPIGYAYAAQFRERAAYGWDTELSVYVARDKHHTGVGHKLYSALIDLLRAQNFVNLYAWITNPNPTSIAFHESIGFEKLCDIPAAGFKHGEWHGVSWYQLRFPPKGAPSPIIPFPDLDPYIIKNTLKAGEDA